MNVLLSSVLWLTEMISPAETRQALGGNLLEQQPAGPERRWLIREVLMALWAAFVQRFGRFGLPLLFSLSWSTLYRGYAAEALSLYRPSLTITIQVFPLHAILRIFLQILPVITFIWIGFALFLCVHKDVVRSMSAVVLASALSASHAALLVLTLFLVKPIHTSTLLHLLLQAHFYVGRVNVPVALCMLIAVLLVLPKKTDPPRRRRRARVRLRDGSGEAFAAGWRSAAEVVAG